ncbi:MAG: VCBS repeat-containing protein, partial [Nannocystaceae bacterium]|nr:VCBS repeat-containing protein [Nannocystaceae bacterium]
MLRQFLLCPCLLWPLACSERTPEASGGEWFESVESLRHWNPSGFIGDFDGDGFDDIALRGRTEPGMAILYGRADSTISETPDLILPPHQEGPPGSAGVVPLGDINGDGLDDIAVVDPTQGESTVFFGRPRTQDGEPSQAVERSFFVDTGVVLPLGDLDADGIDDIGVFFTSTAQHLRAGIVRGRTNWSDIDRESLPTDSIVIENPKASPQRVGDINGDGHDDLAASPSGGALSLHSGATLPWGTTVVDTLPAPDLGGLDAPADQSPFVGIPGAYVPGVSVYPLGDLDGDELDDFAAGHMWSERPVTFVIYGSTVPLLRSRASLS